MRRTAALREQEQIWHKQFFFLMDAGTATLLHFVPSIGQHWRMKWPQHRTPAVTLPPLPPSLGQAVVVSWGTWDG